MKFFISILTLIFVCSFAKAEDPKDKGGFYIGAECHISRDAGYTESLTKQCARGGNVLVVGYLSETDNGYQLMASTNWLPFNNGYKAVIGGNEIDVKSNRASVGASKIFDRWHGVAFGAGLSASHIRTYVNDIETSRYNAISPTLSIVGERIGVVLSATPASFTSKPKSASNTFSITFGVKL